MGKGVWLKIFSLSLLLFCLSACVSMTQVMQGYVGRPVSDVVMDLGPPVTAFDLDQNTRVFMWRKSSTYNTGSYVNTYGTSNTQGTVWNANSYIAPAQTINVTCYYAFYAKRAHEDINGPAAWVVTGFKPPSASCN